MKECKYGCGLKIEWKGKDPSIPNDTGFREEDGSPHLYKKCFDLQKSKKEPEKEYTPSTKPYEAVIYQGNEKKTVKVIPETEVEHPTIFDAMFHLCPKCGSKLWVTEKYNAEEGLFHKKCFDCKYKESFENIYDSEYLNRKLT